MQFFLFGDAQYLLVLIPTLILSLGTSLFLKYVYGKYLEIGNLRGLTGEQVAIEIMKNKGWSVALVSISGELTDNFNPSTKTLGLSREVAASTSLASAAIVAHEFGHVEQDQQDSFLLKIRGSIVPAVNIGTSLGYVLIILGLMLSFINLAWVGVFLFSLSFFFALLTLPIEIDASRRGLRLLSDQGIINSSEMPGARWVLLAAALTYLAAMISSLLNVLYFLLRISQASSRRR